MQLYMKKGTIILSALLALWACSESPLLLEGQGESLPIELGGQIVQENVTRADDRGFVTGDRMGIYIVDRDGEATLGATDNRASNVLFTYDGDGYRWTSPTQIYWRDQETAIDVYGYYPGANYINNPTAWQFSVQTDQSTEAANGDLSGYEQSDLLWGKTTSRPTTDQIVVKYGHILAGVRVQLQKGTGISDTEWEKLEKIVLVDNTVTTATVNLATGTVLPTHLRGGDGGGVTPIRMAPQAGGHYRAIVIPQTVAAQKQLLSITLDGQTYSHKLGKAMQYEAGKLHNFTMTVNKSELTGDYEVKVTDDGITPWENDQSSHQFTANAYVVVNCPEPGKLEESIRAAGYDPATIQSLKVTGELNHTDILWARGNIMENLKNLNLKDARFRRVEFRYGWEGIGEDGFWHTRIEDDVLPEFGFNEGLRTLILPSTLKGLSSYALANLQLMNTTLEIPDGVRNIGNNAFTGYNDFYKGARLILPSRLDSIGTEAFFGCVYDCELQLSDDITYVGEGAFAYTDYFYGTFHVPAKLNQFYFRTFESCGRVNELTGTIEIPQGTTEIPNSCFSGIPFKHRIDLVIPQGVKKIGLGAFCGVRLSSLSFPDDLIQIGSISGDGSIQEWSGKGAFLGASIPFPLHLPDGLVYLGENSFASCGIEGELDIPESCVFMGDGCFSDNQITKVTLPSQLENIGKQAFAWNSLLQYVMLPKYIDRIGDGAFESCKAMQTIVSLNPEPPSLGDNVFTGIAFDKCILQVPEQSISAYRQAEGWNQFLNITPYRELAVNITEVSALNHGITRKGIIRAEGSWELTECPSWCTVEPMQGTGKAEVVITIKPQQKEDSDREGRIAFSLKDKDYTIYVPLQQLSSEYGENETIVLQKASAGAPYEIPLYFVGDGYSAEDIKSGKYLNDVKEQVEYLFSCEPYKSYRNYFTISVSFAVSPESGIPEFYGSPLYGKTRFDTSISYGAAEIENREVVWEYIREHGQGVNEQTQDRTTVVLLLNTNQGSNFVDLDYNGRSLVLLRKSIDPYPYDQRGCVLHYVGGLAFGKLASEDVQHYTFAKSCTCGGCLCWVCYWDYKARGWFENVSASGKRNEVPWKDFIYHPQYAKYVDIYEGAYRHARGFYRSEEQSVMSTYIPYYNAISRQSIVKRILEYSGEGYTFEKFVAKDKREYPEE